MPWTTTTATRSGVLIPRRTLALRSERVNAEARQDRSVCEPGHGAPGGGAPCPVVELDGQLIADRQPTDSLARRGEDRVAKRRRNRRHAGLAHTAHRLGVVTAWNDVDTDSPGRRTDAGHLVGIEVVLLDAPALVADLAERRDADAHDGRAFHLCPNALRVHRGAAVHRD